MSLTLTVHRGTQQIGGSCIEIAHQQGDRIILDAGRPIDAPDGVTGLLPASLDRSRPATVLISHPHQDHWGLVEELPPAWPIWTGSGSAKLIAVRGDLTRRPLTRTFETWDSRSGPFAIGPFTVTPILTDHSAFDAYMLLVEGAGKRLLYTGDFRRHGRKSALVDRIMAHPPADIDVLLTEGTNLGSDKPVKSENELEYDFVELLERTKGRVFVAWSGQNVDRTVTIYRAAKRTGRTLAIDLYTADVLDRISEATGLPRSGFPNLKVVVTRGLRSNYRTQGREDFVERMVPYGISAKCLEGSRHVVMLRRGLIRDYQSAGVVPTADDAFNFSMWRGYLSDPYHSEALEWCRAAGAEIAYIHTSGHASPADLRAFAAAVRPKTVVPVHGVKWEEESYGLRYGPPPWRRTTDGSPVTIIVAPKTALAPTRPAVGIFWLVNGILVIDRTTLDDAEPYGECITHAAGHYERWQEWQALGGVQRASAGYPDRIASTEYDQWPRGRIVYEPPTRRFVLYADRHLQRPDIIDALKIAFGLNGTEVIVRSDSHYR